MLRLRFGNRLILLSLAALCIGFVACGDETDSGTGTPTDAGSTSDAGTKADAGDAGTTDDAGTPPDAGDETDAGTPADAGMSPDAGMNNGTTATLAGDVIRTGGGGFGGGTGDGKGNLYIGVFTANPINGQNPMLVGQQLIQNVDLSTNTKKVAYQITGIPPRAEPYHVSAFLDDNNNVSAQNPAPDVGDSVAMDNLISQTVPTATLNSATTVTKNLDLNVVRPF